MRTAGAESTDVAQTLDNLAGLYARQKRYRDAEPIYQRELAIREKILGKEHHDTATTINNLACLYTEQRKTKQAEELFIRALAIQEKTLGANHPEVANTCENYAILLRKVGRITDARANEKRAKEIRSAAHP